MVTPPLRSDRQVSEVADLFFQTSSRIAQAVLLVSLQDFYHIEIKDLAGYTLLPYIVQGALGLVSGVLAGAWEAHARALNCF